MLWLAFVVRGFWYCALLPPWEGYDEPFHFAALQNLAAGNGMPHAGDPVSLEVQKSLHLLPLPWQLHFHEIPRPLTPHEDFWELPPNQREQRIQAVRALAPEDALRPAIERIVNAEAAASGAPRPPEITRLDQYPLNVNDAEATRRVADAFRRHFPAERVRQTGPAPASEDFGSFGTEWHVPSVFWFVGGTDPDVYAQAKKSDRLNELPVNHSPLFAPVIHPTLKTGVETLVVAAQAWFSPQQ